MTDGRQGRLPLPSVLPHVRARKTGPTPASPPPAPSHPPPPPRPPAPHPRAPAPQHAPPTPTPRRAREAELRRTPSTQWYRLQRAVEPTDLAFVVETPRALVPSAQLRIELTVPHAAAALGRARTALTTELAPALQRQRVQAAAG